MSETEATLEDLEQIKNTIHELQNLDDISVFDFVTLISNYTQDKGEMLQKVLNEDLSHFKDTAETKAARLYNRIKNEHLAFERDNTKNIVSLLSAVKDILETINKEHPGFNLKMYESDRKHFIKKLYPRKKKVELSTHKKHEDLNAVWNSHKNEFKHLQEENKDLYNTLNELQREFEFKDNKMATIEQGRIKEIEQLKMERSRLQDQLNQLQSTIDNILSIKNNRKKRSPFGSPDRRYMPKSELRFMEENSSTSKKELMAPSTSRLPPIKPDYWTPVTNTKSINDCNPVPGTSARNISPKGSPTSVNIKDHVKKYKLDTLLDNYLKRKERKESDRSLSPSRRDEKLV